MNEFFQGEGILNGEAIGVVVEIDKDVLSFRLPFFNLFSTKGRPEPWAMQKAKLNSSNVRKASWQSQDFSLNSKDCRLRLDRGRVERRIQNSSSLSFSNLNRGGSCQRTTPSFSFKGEAWSKRRERGSRQSFSRLMCVMNRLPLTANENPFGVRLYQPPKTSFLGRR